MERALEADRLESSLRTELFDDLRRMIAENHNAGSASGLLLRLDRERALAVLTSDECLSEGHPAIYEILRTLAYSRTLVPKAKLLPIIVQLEARDLNKYPHYYTLGEALVVLARHRDPADRELLERYSRHAKDELAERALNGLVLWQGLDDFEERIIKIANERGESALTPAQRAYMPIMLLDGEVNNGGFSQYFFNSSGDFWREALAGLELMGLNERANVLKAAVAKFGSTPPSANREERMRQMAVLENAEASPFETIESRYYKCEPALRAAVLRYVIEHAAEFE
jgi:hypothetical protein